MAFQRPLLSRRRTDEAQRKIECCNKEMKIKRLLGVGEEGRVRGAGSGRGESPWACRGWTLPQPHVLPRSCNGHLLETGSLQMLGRGHPGLA